MVDEVPEEFKSATGFGGVVVDEHGWVLLCRPYDPVETPVIEWTLPKGRLDDGETPVTTALREVLEETGYEARIERPLPGVRWGTFGRVGYFLMRVGARTGIPLADMSGVAWFSFDEGLRQVRRTRSQKHRERDESVLLDAKKELGL